MKKFEVRSLLAILMVAAMLFAFVACGGDSETLPPDSSVDATEPVEVEPTETDPVEAEPDETEAPATEPAVTEPAATEPATTEPAETKPVETKPVETEAVVTECAHKYGSGKKVIPTCQAEGYTEYTCTECGETKKDDVLPKVDHLYVNVTLAATTCTEDGKTAEQCTYCGNTKNEQTIPAYGHVEVLEILDSPTFTHHKIQVAICKFCSFNHEPVGVQGEEHVFTFVELVRDEIDHSGLVRFGYELFKCEECGYLLKVSSNHVSGHYFEARSTDGKLACSCGAVVSSFNHNGNKAAGPVMFVD